MATNPRVRTRVQATAGAPGGGTDVVCILAASPENADAKPRLFGSADKAFALHGCSRGIEYASLHSEETGLSFMYVRFRSRRPASLAGSTSRDTRVRARLLFPPAPTACLASTTACC